ncbi:MAG: hypothetical protein KAI81_00455 [Candidatus Marinimicrobia bacterium]|nr:hypothetical protein [Candidatus Neomarinimicrobiota bacterium]
MKKKNIWLSYDLGIKGDYPGLYRWLDMRNAKECGTSVAHLSFEYLSDFLKELIEDLKKDVELKNDDRIYAVYRRKDDDEKLSTVGKFIIGNRKASPWEGYAPLDEDLLDE